MFSPAVGKSNICMQFSRILSLWLGETRTFGFPHYLVWDTGSEILKSTKLGWMGSLVMQHLFLLVKGRDTLWTARIKWLMTMDRRLVMCGIKIMKCTSEYEVCGSYIRVTAILVKLVWCLLVFILYERAKSLEHQLLYLDKLWRKDTSPMKQQLAVTNMLHHSHS